MKNNSDINTFTAARNSLGEIYSDTSYDLVPILDQYENLDSYRAFDHGELAEVPQALAAYVDHQQLLWL